MAAWLYPLLLLFGLAAPPPDAGPTPRIAPPGPDLDRIAVAVEGAESSFGMNQAMWRPNPWGPQGPMQVSAAAAADVGNGDRFDPDDNRRLGRAYLALLYRRYGNWTDAVVAYYWGPGNVDRWVVTGHGPDSLSVPLRAYVERVLHGFLSGTPPIATQRGAVAAEVAAAEPPIVDIRNPALRKKYLADRAVISELRAYLAATAPASVGGDPTRIMGLIRRVAVRRGFEEFASLRTAHGATPTAPAVLRQIARALIDKLRSECAAIVIVDQRQVRRPP